MISKLKVILGASTLLGVFLLATGTALAADPCLEAMTRHDVQGIETICAPFRTSTNKKANSLYYGSLATAYYARTKLANGNTDPNHAKALANFTKTIALVEQIGPSQNDHLYYRERCFLYLWNRPPTTAISPDADKAMKDATRAIALKSNDADSYLCRALAHNQMKNNDAAWADAKRARELNPSSADIQGTYEALRGILERDGKRP